MICWCMPRDGAITFRDIAGKLAVLRVERDKCGRRGSYPLDRLIERYGIDAKLFDFEPEADCRRKIARNHTTPAAPGARIWRRWCEKSGADSIGGGKEPGGRCAAYKLLVCGPDSAYVCQDMPSAKGEAAMIIHFIIEFGLAWWLFVVWRRADGPMGGHLIRLDVRLTNLEARVTEIEKARTPVH
jgi:hypothetical protein